MAGYTRIFCIGGEGGFRGADGINPIRVQIWQGDGNRRWYEARYFEKGLGPLGDVRTVIPTAPDDPNALLDACLAFFPEAFSDCPTLEQVAERLTGVEFLDLNLDGVPPEWAALREEARSTFSDLAIYAAELRPLEERSA